MFNSGIIGPVSQLARLFLFLAGSGTLSSRAHPWSPMILTIINGAIRERSPPSQRWHRYYFMVYLFTRDVTRDRPDSSQTRIYEVRRGKKTLVGPSVSLGGPIARYPNEVTRIDRPDSIIETL